VESSLFYVVRTGTVGRDVFLQSSKFMLVSPAQSFLVSGPVGTHDHIFVLPQILRVLKWGLLFDERRGLTNTGYSISNEE
jgi:hypothetical protein